MAIQINIEGTDRTKYVDKKSLRIESVLTSQVDTCSFKIVSYTGHSYTPSPGDEVIIYDKDGNKVFGGNIIAVNDIVDTYKKTVFEVKCKDYTDLMDSKLVAETYHNKTVAYIINDIKDNYMGSGFTANNIHCNKKLSFIAFNYEVPSKCLQRLAELVGYEWYVDYDKDIHFFPKERNSASFNLTDTCKKYIYNSLRIKKDKSQMRNVVYVKGGHYLGNTSSAEQVADGEQTEFKLPYKYSNIQVWVDSAAKTVGTDFLDTFDDYDCLYNYQEKVIRFPDGSKPAQSDVVKYKGRPYIPVIIKISDNVSVQEYGAKEHRIEDRRIKNKEAARERAKAELESYKDIIEEGRFQTIESGLSAGQYINIQSDARSIDEDYLINKVVARTWNNDQFIYTVYLVSTKSFGIIEFLQSLLTSEKGKIVIDEDEVIDTVEAAYENVNIGETVTAALEKTSDETVNINTTVTSYNHTPPFLWAPNGKKSFRFRWNLSEWG